MPRLTKYSATERQEGKLHIKDELSQEDCNWLEFNLKQNYWWSKHTTYRLVTMLSKLKIPLFVDEQEKYYYYDYEEDFVEKVVKPPKGWVWAGSTIEKDPRA